MAGGPKYSSSGPQCFTKSTAPLKVIDVYRGDLAKTPNDKETSTSELQQSNKTCEVIVTLNLTVTQISVAPGSRPVKVRRHGLVCIYMCVYITAGHCHKLKSLIRHRL